MRSVGAAGWFPDYTAAVGTSAEVPGRPGGAARCDCRPAGDMSPPLASSRWQQEPGRAAATDCEKGKGLPYFDWSRSCSQ
jgi:hypothetical protein